MFLTVRDVSAPPPPALPLWDCTRQKRKVMSAFPNAFLSRDPFPPQNIIDASSVRLVLIFKSRVATFGHLLSSVIRDTTFSRFFKKRTKLVKSWSHGFRNYISESTRAIRFVDGIAPSVSSWSSRRIPLETGAIGVETFPETVASWLPVSTCTSR